MLERDQPKGEYLVHTVLLLASLNVLRKHLINMVDMLKYVLKIKSKKEKKFLSRMDQLKKNKPSFRVRRLRMRDEDDEQGSDQHPVTYLGRPAAGGGARRTLRRHGGRSSQQAAAEPAVRLVCIINFQQESTQRCRLAFQFNCWNYFHAAKIAPPWHDCLPCVYLFWALAREWGAPGLGRRGALLDHY
mgnify:CR=1 FL=1